MTEYTPGPWGLFDGTDIWPINADGGGYIARLRFRGEAVETATGDREFPETEANARLIAAAPDLLEAAKDALESLTECGPHRSEGLDCEACGESIAALRAAILQAEGGE